VDLPTEAEWEKSARGGVDIPVKASQVMAAKLATAEKPEMHINLLPGRKYPWGDEFDPQRANIDETQVGSTSAPGCFPGGIGAYGQQELSGNVWEWCRSQFEAYPYQAEDGRDGLAGMKARAVRGGAYIFGRGFARCAYRASNYPVDWFVFMGFRVIVRLGAAVSKQR
jgi:formylglycine-generating enzyme required for sulfatase activity